MIFSFLRPNPIKKLQTKYQNIMQKAQQAQRNGDMDLFARLSGEGADILKQIEQLKSEKEKK